MHVLTLQCPHCRARLRVRDQSFIGRTIHCPDCAERLEIVRDGAGEVIGRPPRTDGDSPEQPRPADRGSRAARDGDRAAEAASRGASPAAKRRPAGSASHGDPTARATRIAWGVAGGLGLGLALWAVWGAPDKPQPQSPPAEPRAAAPASSGAEPDGDPRPPAASSPTAPATNSSAAPSPGPSGAAAPPSAPPEGVAALPESARSLRTFADWVADYERRHGQFPTERPEAGKLPASSRLGWIAELVAEREPGGPQPLWDQPLEAPLNSRFVRRRMPALLNPTVAEAAADGWPATHFVGVAGVGADGPRLPATHPRAGIFGLGRSTRADDVVDGLSHTLLLVGLERDFAPWAGGGERTIRSFTAEPYLRGPDGFGTGQLDGMFVAMADGSVRFVSQNVDPVVLRRMAAMADRLPLDPAIPGEPGDSPRLQMPVASAAVAAPAGQPPADAVGVPGPGLEGAGANRSPAPRSAADSSPAAAAQDHAPIAAEVAADVAAESPPVVPKRSYDIARALQQPIRRFSQVRPIRCRELLLQIEELAGIPIDIQPIAGHPDARRLEQEVSLELADTTVEGILKAALAKAELTFETGAEFGVRVTAGKE